jgi:hypothetical protein
MLNKIYKELLYPLLGALLLIAMCRGIELLRGDVNPKDEDHLVQQGSGSYNGGDFDQRPYSPWIGFIEPSVR